MILEDFVKNIYSKTPEFDEDLFRLKKKLEEWLETNLKEKEIDIQEFAIWSINKITIYYKKNLEAQQYNTSINLTKIKDKELDRFICQYKNHDFR